MYRPVHRCMHKKNVCLVCAGCVLEQTARAHNHIQRTKDTADELQQHAACHVAVK